MLTEPLFKISTKFGIDPGKTFDVIIIISIAIFTWLLKLAKIKGNPVHY